MARDDGGLDDARLLRYSRHILLDEFGVEAQQRLLDAHVLIVGLGGLGNPAALYLANAGVGHLVLVDGDRIEATNLQRQVLFHAGDIGRAKVAAAKQELQRCNADVVVDSVDQRVDANDLLALVAAADVVLDCSDNFTTRHALNRACVSNRTTLISGAAIRFDGQVSVFDLRHDDAPCYACLFPDLSADDQDDCATMGVFAPLTGMIGTLQAAEAIKAIAGIGTSLSGRLFMADALHARFDSVEFQRDPGCLVCAVKPSHS